MLKWVPLFSSAIFPGVGIFLPSTADQREDSSLTFAFVVYGPLGGGVTFDLARIRECPCAKALDSAVDVEEKRYMNNAVENFHPDLIGNPIYCGS